jgi:isoleucyl-tRNA synthetase
VPVILDALKVAGRLMDTTTISHSYPHCWRHKTPVIYRAAAQWFIRMDEGEGVFTDPRKSPRRPCARSRWKPSSRPASTPKTARTACAT